MSLKVLHVIEALSLGGAGRALIGLAKYSRARDGHRHAVLPLSLQYSDPAAIELAGAAGIELVPAVSAEERARAMADADIVQVHWWNSPRVQDFCRAPLPEGRFISWMHIAGDRMPQVITAELLSFFDISVACSAYTYQNDAIQGLPTDVRLERTAMAFAGTDFARLAGASLKPHQGFVVGYVGTVDFVKMHRNYVAMSARISVPDIRFVVCGTGGHVQVLREEAQALGAAAKFEIKGYVSDIRPELERFDVYGYPLCEDTYAAAELNLQEALYLGVPAVVFPYGGVSLLVLDGFTGLVVRSEREYAEAIEFLYREPAERARLGANAKNYAQQMFGAENAAKSFSEVYKRAMTVPKRLRSWGADSARPLLEQPVSAAHVSSTGSERGTAIFLDSLGELGAAFQTSASVNATQGDKLAADREITRSSQLLRTTGIAAYRNHYSGERLLHYWSGLTHYGTGDYAQALRDFDEAERLGFSEPRLDLYRLQAARKAGDRGTEEMVEARLKLRAPELLAAEAAA